MSSVSEFGKAARDLSKNPLGVIALFIVLIYGMATIVVIEGNKLTTFQRDVFVWFLSTYPALVLFIFAWLVSRHSAKLYAPQDFKNQEHWMKLQEAKAMLAAYAKENTGHSGTSSMDIGQDSLIDNITQPHG